MSDFKKMVLDMMINIILSFDKNVNSATSILTSDIFEGKMYEYAVTISDLIKPFALTIIAFVFLLEMIKIGSRFHMIRYEDILACLFKVCLAKWSMNLIFPLLSAIYAQVAEWVLKIGISGSTLGDTVGVYIQNEFTDMGFWESLGLVVSMMLVFVAIQMIGLLVIVIAYARKFELLSYLSVSPIPFGFLPMEDNGRITRKFVFRFAGVCLQGLFIIISIKLYAMLCDDVIIKNLAAGSVSDLAYNMLLGALVLIMAVVKSGTWANQLLDAV